MSDEVLLSVDNGLARIRLNRPKAIHALTAGMCEAINTALLDWRDDPAVVAVMIDHAEGRGFCAGGDITLIARSAKGDRSEAEHFFFVEYRMNHLLYTYPKPAVAFMDGITMGGGVGISQPARYRVATERTVFAMPETGIGLFPDVGGGWYLPRLPGRTGAWLAVTGARIDGADCRALGLATHYIASEKLEALKDAIIADPASLQKLVDDAEDTSPPAKIDSLRPDIDRLFASDRYDDIVAALQADGSEWARAQLAILATKSPQTIKLSLRQLALGKDSTDFGEHMRMEYRIACHVIARPDIVEGVRALIIDKDNAPRWNPAKPEDVSDALVESFFTPLPADREWTPFPETGA